VTKGKTQVPHHGLLSALKKQAVLRDGPYRLASGLMSDYYIDCRLAFLQQPAILFAGVLCDYLMVELNLTCIAGPTSGADPIVASTVIRDSRYRGGFVRKSTKDHGTGKLVEGPLRSGDRALVVEDVTTTGSSLLSAALALNEAGIHTPYALAMVDRGVDPKRFDELGIKFYYCVGGEELLS
jgi:orotate phosphoribosyltransferase